MRCADSQESRLRLDIERLAGEIGERNFEHYPKLLEAAAFIEQSFEAVGYRPVRQEYEAQGQRFANIEVELLGQDRPQEVLIVGAHYDTERGSPGANDNASGVAALMALAREFANKPLARTLRLVAFTNEERPFLRTEKMGSRVYVRRCRERHEMIVGMLSLESIGGSEMGLQAMSYPSLVSSTRAKGTSLPWSPIPPPEGFSKKLRSHSGNMHELAVRPLSFLLIFQGLGAPTSGRF